MNRLTLALTRPVVRLRRLTHRRGYGVHSPFAFEYITRVVLEHTPYYIYSDVERAEAGQATSRGRAWAMREPRRVKRLLLRISNRARPSRILDIGAASSAALYLQAGCLRATYRHVDNIGEFFMPVTEGLKPSPAEALSATCQVMNSCQVPVDGGTDRRPQPVTASPNQLVYLHDHCRPDLMRQAFDTIIPTAGDRDVILVEGIGYSRAMRALWKDLRAHPRTGITMDLHDLGIIFLDRHIRKHDYTVSF